ncbi:MAG TPA: tail fiber domain-containing protein [Candidatus Limnocylindrales bacterium]|nr:tail fiber domain-containing protein [Candidatus Limnocylindrales bacterium]
MNRYAKFALICVSFASMPLLMAPRNGAGTYSLPAGNPVVSGTTISSTVHNNTMSDIATALTASISKDGQTTPTANLPMGGFRHTNVGNPTVRSQYGTVDNIQDGEYVVLSSVAGTNTVTAALSPTPTAYVAGMQVVLIPANTNTGATTLNISSIGALDVQKWVSGAQSNIVANDLRVGVPAYLVLDTGADDWILLNPNSGNIGDVTTGTMTATTVSSTNLTVTNINGVAAPAAANPSATIGLSAVNGSATSFMRSDGAPALSQSIAPTWTAHHIFSNSWSSGNPGAATVSAAVPFLELDESDAAADNRRWSFNMRASEQFLFQLSNDARNSFGTVFSVDRTGTTVDQVTFPTEGSRAFVIGTAGTTINSARAQIRTTSAAASLQVSNATSNQYTIVSNNEAGSGDNQHLVFTEGATIRGSIDYNRAGAAIRYNTTSDARLKKNFKSAPSARPVIDCILVESFDWREGGERVNHGLVAQRLNKCAPYAVSKGDVWQIEKAALVPALIKYVQEQDDRISRLERRLERLH